MISVIRRLWWRFWGCKYGCAPGQPAPGCPYANLIDALIGPDRETEREDDRR